MRSVSDATTRTARPRAPSAATDPDRTARARIRAAAIARFGSAGIATTTVRAIAADAGVSPGLVIHHFGSKEGLRAACDAHVAAAIREGKTATMAAGPGLDPVAALRSLEDAVPLLRYLARALAEPSPQVDALVDEMVADAVTYLAQGERSGMLRPSEDPPARAAVLTVWSLGALALHGHLARLLGADVLDGAAGLAAYSRPALEVLGPGVLTPEAFAQVSTVYRSLAPESDHAPSSVADDDSPVPEEE